MRAIYQVVPIAAPTDEETRAALPVALLAPSAARGRIAIFDRSWYGRVLVERVEGLCAEADWMRAYGEINDFEEQLARHGIVVVKFWLQISKDEQLRRFKERETTAFKRFKITDEDWRNREQVGRLRAARSATWSTAPAPSSRRGRWSRPTTSATPASRC